ncbi:MAG TPA: malto-oligosyltrehalose trehalohydrolase [Burkholderiales bacterium]|nr:malto-oligosyltrehalose trehalohydrolase [Burkholderiales bacterium]
MRRMHRMPFGAEPAGGNRTRFHLWAPTARSVDLVLTDGGGTFPMPDAGDGWRELTVEAPAGTRYRYRIDSALEVPDPASRFNPDDVHAASEVLAPEAFEWPEDGWRGRPWEEAVLYELHVGTFSPEGTFAGVEARLDYLAGLGVTAIELMPVADFPGRRGWGYDGVLPFAPDAAYGRPEDFKRLVAQAHARRLMVLLDVVYNHFGPDGNYLHAYAKHFFTERHETPWGAAINFDDRGSRTVRDFFIHNALYWLEEYQLDGLRFDAVHAIADDSMPDIMMELAECVRAGPGASREVHLVLENDRNQSRYLGRTEDNRPRWHTAQWNDDIHHAFHVLLTGEADGYYADYAKRPAWCLGRSLAEGFSQQGDLSEYRDGSARGEPSAHLPPAAFVSFLQTHDQVGNRAFGERLSTLAEEAPLRAATVVWLLAPAPPLLFMGEEFGATTPFLFFCDFGPELAAAVTAGRRREFSRFARFSDPAAQAAIPDPNAPDTFARSGLDWTCTGREPHARWLKLYRELLALRREKIAPRLRGMGGNAGRFDVLSEGALTASWHLGNGSRLSLYLNLSTTPAPVRERPQGTLLRCEPSGSAGALASGQLPPFTAACFLAEKGA